MPSRYIFVTIVYLFSCLLKHKKHVFVWELPILCYCFCLTEKKFKRRKTFKLYSHFQEKSIFIIWQANKTGRMLYCVLESTKYFFCVLIFYTISLPLDTFPFNIVPVVIVYPVWTSWSILILDATLLFLSNCSRDNIIPTFCSCFTIRQEVLWMKKSAPQKILHRKWDLMDWPE